MVERLGARRRADLVARRIATATAGAWIVGVVALTALCIVVAARGHDAEVDSRLRAHALAAYGLGWFDASGAFHGEVLEKETALLAGDVRISIATPSATVFGPADPDAVGLVDDALQAGDEVWRDRASERVLALPTFDDADRPAGAVIVATPVGPARAATLRFGLMAAAIALGFAGLGVAFSRRLSARVLGAMLESIAERERILAGAAHELRTPLATLTTLADSPLEDLEATLAQVGATARDAAELVDRLLTWSRLAEAAPQREAVRLDLLVELCLGDDEPLDAEEATLHADPRLVRIAVSNLVENARRHGGGVKLVRVRPGVVEVHDHGPGIGDRRLLAPFTKRGAGPGTGLGLAVVERIAEAHGGRLDLGPPVTLRLPS